MGSGIWVLAIAWLAAQAQEVPAERYEHLSPAITIEHIAEARKSKPSGADFHMTQEDFAQLAADGFRCVRFPVAFDDDATKSTPAALTEAIQNAEDAGLSVIVAPELTPSAGNTDWAIRATATLAVHEDPSRFFVELNPKQIDPVLSGSRQAEEALIGAFRALQPRMTLLVPMGDFAEGAGNPDFVPYGAGNLVYTFGFSAPLIFTTQGLAGAMIRRDDSATLPYPATVGSIASLLGNFDDKSRDQILAYARTGWSADKITECLKPYGEWAREHRLRIVMDGFGVSQHAAAVDRANYLGELRQAAEDNGIGWCLREYFGPYGIFTGGARGRKADAGVLAALGLSGG